MNYYRCSKCGETLSTDFPLTILMCHAPCDYRTSGICCGELKEIDVMEFVTLNKENEEI